MRRLAQATLAFLAFGYFASGCGARTGSDLYRSGVGAGATSGGFGGSGGYGGSGYGGSGGTIGCSYPSCSACTSACALCLCQTGNNGPACASACGAGGGGFGGGGFGGGGFGGGGFGGGGFGGVGGGPSDCCFPQPNPGCVPASTAQCVCAKDPFCCQSQWDAQCAGEVQQLGCGFCGAGGAGGAGGFGGVAGFGGGTYCNGAFCDSVTVPTVGITLNACCSGSPSNPCGVDTSPIASFVPLPNGCVETYQPGYPDPACPPMPTPTGITLAGCCKPDGLCGNDFGLISLGCVETWMYGGPPPVKCGGMGGFGGAAGAAGAGGFTGSCCSAHTWPGCDNPNVASCVCGKDSFCCNSQWDSTCVNEGTSCGSGCGGSGGFDGGLCNPSFCPAPPGLQACCIGPNGPCGIITPSGCQQVLVGDGGP